jgi:hypothetical protein
MPFPDPLRTRFLDERWPEFFGFDATQIDRSLVVGEPPLTVAIYQGRFDEGALRTAWEASGYQPVELPDAPNATVYSLSEDESIDLANEVQRLVLSGMNNLAFLPDGTLIAASRLDNVERALATIRGEAPSLLDRPEVATLVATSDPGLVAAFLVTGGALQALDPARMADQIGEEQTAALATAAAEERARVGAMPMPELALLGLTAGGPLINVPVNEAGTPEPFLADPPLARFVLALLFADRATAEAAIPVVESRLAAGKTWSYGRPFTEFFAGWEVEVTEEAPVLLVDLTYVDDVPPDIAFVMFVRRDLGFVAW